MVVFGMRDGFGCDPDWAGFGARRCARVGYTAAFDLGLLALWLWICAFWRHFVQMLVVERCKKGLTMS